MKAPPLSFFVYSNCTSVGLLTHALPSQRLQINATPGAAVGQLTVDLHRRDAPDAQLLGFRRHVLSRVL